MLVAAFIVRSLPVVMLRWLVAAGVVYTAPMLLRTAARRKKTADA